MNTRASQRHQIAFKSILFDTVTQGLLIASSRLEISLVIPPVAKFCMGRILSHFNVELSQIYKLSCILCDFIGDTAPFKSRMMLIPFFTSISPFREGLVHGIRIMRLPFSGVVFARNGNNNNSCCKCTGNAAAVHKRGTSGRIALTDFFYMASLKNTQIIQALCIVCLKYLI